MKVIHKNGPVLVRGKNQHGEWEVKNGRSIYYTDDRQDAIDTCDEIARKEEAKKHAPAIALASALNQWRPQ